ncbi:MAG: GNAT family N-acetyltransferase [Ginsengibacter sp.]
MISIIRATENDSSVLSQISRDTFKESHGISAPIKEISSYIFEKYNKETLKNELADSRNIYHLLYYNEEVVGYSKIILNSPYRKDAGKNIAKLERIFLLKKVYDKKLGLELLNFNLNFMEEHRQSGAWLYVWVENERAISFYKKNGFRIIGSYDFKISKNHTNPNHQMFLDFSNNF